MSELAGARNIIEDLYVAAHNTYVTIPPLEETEETILSAVNQPEKTIHGLEYGSPGILEWSPKGDEKKELSSPLNMASFAWELAPIASDLGDVMSYDVSRGSFCSSQKANS